MRISHIVAASVLAAAITTPAMAQQTFEEQLFVNVSAGWKYFDDKREFTENAEFHYGAELRFLPNWAAELNYTRGETKTKYGPHARDSYTEVRLDGLYYFSDDVWQPFVAAGVGDASFDDTGFFGKRNEFRMNAGGGVRYIVDDNFSLRGGLRAFYGPRDDLFDAVVTIGASVNFSLNQ